MAGTILLALCLNGERILFSRMTEEEFRRDIYFVQEEIWETRFELNLLIQIVIIQPYFGKTISSGMNPPII